MIPGCTSPGQLGKNCLLRPQTEGSPHLQGGPFPLRWKGVNGRRTLGHFMTLPLPQTWEEAGLGTFLELLLPIARYSLQGMAPEMGCCPAASWARGWERASEDLYVRVPWLFLSLEDCWQETLLTGLITVSLGFPTTAPCSFAANLPAICTYSEHLMTVTSFREWAEGSSDSRHFRTAVKRGAWVA